MLMRNINQTCGLCNGTRLLVTQLLNRVIEAEIITGTSIGSRDVFGHGQLYVALSRSTSPNSLKILIAPQEGRAPNTTTNIVFSEFLAEISLAEVAAREEMQVAASLSDITPMGDAVPVQIRVLNKWRPYHMKPTLSYLFVDAQALFNDAEEIHLDSKLTLMNCYRIEAYKCTRAPSVFRVTTHPAAMEIDRAIPITPITDDDAIPRFYFDFKTHDQLYNKVNKNELLTGKVERVTEVDTETRGKLTKILLHDPSHPEIEVTLWEEIGSRVDLQALTATDHVVIVAITALKVTRHPGTGSLQLQSTAGTSVKIDPDVQLAKAMASAFAMVVLPQEHADVQPARLHFMEKPSERKRRTLGTIRNEDPMLIPHAVYTCEAKLVGIDEDQAWYCVTDIIADNTGTATVTMFGSAVASMLGVSCYDMIHEHGNNDKRKMPTLMNSMKEVTKIFQLEKGKLDHSGLRFAVNKVFTATSRAAIMHTTPPEKGTSMPSTCNNKEASSSTSLIETKARRALFDGQDPDKENNKKQKVTESKST
ncbi:hypothetical protein SSX86_032822 [Deinandra increscens subsp. villosa]|uniref:DNA helicase Pif1-like 2B domain-containing protein n=1 Tax=Deinandra increscens subsp. villosa TaxID=3103831 RepID=A0AAP0C6H9_9ASTR